MKKYFFLAIAATALASCSSDQIVELKEGDEIKFTAVADNDSRATTVYCNNNLPEDFTLYATYTKDGGAAQNFIPGEKFSTSDYLTWTSDEGATRYWPEDGTLDFYAVKNAELDWTAKTITNFTPASEAAEQVDLIYAVALDKQKAKSITDNASVQLNFRHALSQIEFKAKNTNPRLYVEVTGVKVGKAKKTATYTLPEGDTDDNLLTHKNENLTDAINRGAWSAYTDTQDYEITFDAVELNGAEDAEPVSLSFETHGSTGSIVDNSNSLLLLPQNTSKWTPAPNETEYDGAYLAVKCKIWNVANNAVDKENDAVLHNEAYAVIPVDFNWAEGKKYVYTFNFTTTGNGGYEDDPENPQPVLYPITVSLTVDDFEELTEEEKEMKTE